MALQELKIALQSLSKSVSNFNVGAISISDFKPFEQQLSDMRQILKVQKAHSLLLAAKHNSQPMAEKSHEDINTSISLLHEEVAHLQIANINITLCLHACSSDDLMYKDKPTPEFKKQAQGCLRKLFLLNDTLISLHISMIKVLNTERGLEIERPKLLLRYKEFLRKQEDLRDKKLQETNPEISKNKQKLEQKLAKINIMKRLMTNMIATAESIVIKNPFLFEMMKKHRELINIETIIEMARDTASPQSSN